MALGFWWSHLDEQSSPVTDIQEESPVEDTPAEEFDLPADLTLAKDLTPEQVLEETKKRKDMISRSWAYTINNYTPEHIGRVIEMTQSAVYGIAGFEVGKKTGTPHIQGYVHWKDAKSFSQMMKFVHFSYVKPASREAQVNAVYCKKESKILCEMGVMPRQGQRTDIERTYAMLRSGCSMQQITDAQVNLQCIKTAYEWLKYNEPQRDWQPEVVWLYGPKGSGKSHYCKETLGDYYEAPTHLESFWDGYDGHEDVLIDDFRPGRCSFAFLLRLLDKYKMRIPVKGSTRQFRAKRIYITSNMSPQECFRHVAGTESEAEVLYYFDHGRKLEDIGQLTTRLSEIIEFPAASVCLRSDPTCWTIAEKLAFQKMDPTCAKCGPPDCICDIGNGEGSESGYHPRSLQEETPADVTTGFKNYICPDYRGLRLIYDGNSKTWTYGDPRKSGEDLCDSSSEFTDTISCYGHA